MLNIFTWGSEYYATFLNGIVGFIFFMWDLVTSVGNQQQHIRLTIKRHINRAKYRSRITFMEENKWHGTQTGKWNLNDHLCSSSSCPKKLLQYQWRCTGLNWKYGGKNGFLPFFCQFLFLSAIMCFDLQRYLSWCFEVVNGVSSFSTCAAAEKHLRVV